MSGFDTPIGEAYPYGGPGRLLLCRAQEAGEGLLSRYGGKVGLVYLDPPFGTGDGFSVKITGANGKEKLSVPAYRDDMSHDEYIAMMDGVLRLCHGLLSDEGSIYLHIDYRMAARMRLLMDDIFGASNFQNEIIWAYKTGGRSTKHFSRKHDTILFYRKTPKAYFDITAVGVPRGPEKRNNMKRSVDERGRVCFSIRSGGKTYTYYEDTPVYPSDVWCDIEHMHQRDPQRTGYATQKPEALLRRIILASSRPGDIVADLFNGSGTTAAVSSALNREFIAADASSAAIGITRRRLLSAHSGASLLSEGAPFTIEYPHAPMGNIAANFAVARDAGGVRIELKEANSPLGLSYMALGSMDGAGMFRPACYTLTPRVGAKLNEPAGRADMIQLCDHAGCMNFFRI